jgi:FKBP-type peptidyl-prolyl cis-trans isomerase SlyD
MMRTHARIRVTVAIQLAIVTLAVGSVFAESPRKEPEGSKMITAAIQDGATVELEYTLTDDKGEVLDTSTGKEPLTYIHGEGQIIVGLEKALTGLRAGDQRRVVVSPDEAYGHVRPLIEVPTEQVPPQARLLGGRFMARTRNAREPFPVEVKEIKDKTIVLDANHPLAGMTLTFDVKVLSVQPPAGKARP